MSDDGEAGRYACYAAPGNLELSSFETSSAPSDTITLESDNPSRISNVSIRSKVSDRTSRGQEGPSGSSKDLPSGEANQEHESKDKTVLITTPRVDSSCPAAAPSNGQAPEQLGEITS